MKRKKKMQIGTNYHKKENLIDLSEMSAAPEPPFFVALVSGGMAGVAVDVSLFPLDTLKVRFLCCSFTIFVLFSCHPFFEIYDKQFTTKTTTTTTTTTTKSHHFSLLSFFTASFHHHQSH